MKLTHKKKKSGRSIASILIPGLLVLGVSILICMVHVINVRDSFESEIVGRTYDELQDMAMMTQNTANQRLEILKRAAALWESAGITGSEEDVYTHLSRFGELEDFDSIFYIAADGAEIYADGQDDMHGLNNEAKSILSAENPDIRLIQGEQEDSGYSVCYIVPVHDKEKAEGCLVGIHNADMLLSGEESDKLNAKGDLFLIDRDGKIYAQNAALFEDVSQDEAETGDINLLVRLRSKAADAQSVSRISGMERRLHKENYVKTKMVDVYGMTDYLEMRCIENIEDILIVCVYPETVYTDALQPVIFNSLMACIAVVCITLFMLVYVWRTLRKANAEVAALAYDDAITGGRNDNYFRDIASRVIWDITSIPYIVVRFDIVSFRYINEAYGHAKADELLKIVVEESTKVFKGKEVCARMNADQFVMLARNDKEYDEKFNKMLSVINDRTREAGIKLPIRLKCGIYQIRKDDTDIGVIIDRADAARKTLNGDEKVLTVVYSDKIVDQMYEIEQIESQMESALENGEFKVFVQPKWDIVHDRIYGGEALVRWVKADGSRVFPDEFIPIFEKNGFVERLDMYMLEEVCKRQRDLIEQNKTIYPISVNQSRILMHNPDYVNQVAKILKRYRIPKGYIELEMTETVFLEERNLMIATMNKLKKMEVQLSMDDFGSGYSSLNMLKDIPFDVMKIDREFFSESTTSNSSILILRKIIEMAEGLGMRVLCEGVETAEQVELLRNLGCYYVQGYFYSRPLPAEEFIEKYCCDMRGGKAYYDTLYREESVMRMEQRLREAEAVKAQSAKSAVEKFKKTYVAPAEEKKKETDGTKYNGKRLSTEEQKALIMMEREAKHANRTKLPKDVG